MGSTGVASKPPDEISTLLSTCSADVASSLVLVSLNGGTAWAYGNEVTILVVHVVAFMMGASVVSRLVLSLFLMHIIELARLGKRASDRCDKVIVRASKRSMEGNNSD